MNEDLPKQKPESMFKKRKASAKKSVAYTGLLSERGPQIEKSELPVNRILSSTMRKSQPHGEMNPPSTA